MDSSNTSILSLKDIEQLNLIKLLTRYNLILQIVPLAISIPGSYWGDSEAGLIDNTVYARDDTPVHSILHETCHYICMDQQRRMQLDTDAAGDYNEENAVCYLQIILAEILPDMKSERMMKDMDGWGYTFRLGSASDWFKDDAEDAKQWLLKHHLIDKYEKPSFKLRLN